MGSAALLCTLRNMLPEAQFVLVDERPWHSLTFAGAHIRISLTISGNNHAALGASFARMLPAYEFDLADRLVADIAAIETTVGETETGMLMDALILED